MFRAPEQLTEDELIFSIAQFRKPILSIEDCFFPKEGGGYKPNPMALAFLEMTQRRQIDEMERSSASKRSRRSAQRQPNRERDWQHSVYYKWYVADPPGLPMDLPSNLKEFQCTFRVPWALYRRLFDRLRVHPEFEKYGRPDATNKPGIPLAVLLLSALLYLGRHETTSSIGNALQISRSVVVQFFHHFVAFLAHQVFPEEVKMPASEEELRQVIMAQEAAGFPGCTGFCDGTKVI